MDLSNNIIVIPYKNKIKKMLFPTYKLKEIEYDIEIIKSQLLCSHSLALCALCIEDFDVVNALLAIATNEITEYDVNSNDNENITENFETVGRKRRIINQNI